MKRALSSRIRMIRALGAPRANMLVIGTVYGVFALSLIFQSSRWAATPAYANLLAIMPQQAWGSGFAVVAALLGTAIWRHEHRWLSVTALTLALAITATWCTAFVIRWLTSSATTPETWGSWFVFGYLLVRSLLLLGHDEEVRAPSQDGDDRG